MNSNSTDIKEIRKFGLIALFFFGCLCALGIWFKKPLSVYLFGVLSTLGLGFILFPHPLRPVFKAWIKIAHFFGLVITTFVLVLAYYLVITPAAFIKRLFGGTPLPIRPNKKISSYWVTREQAAQPNEQFLKRF